MLFCSQFSSKSDNSSFDWWKTLKSLLKQIFQPNICKKCDIYWQKTCWGCLIKLKFGTQVNQFVLKKHLKISFLSGELIIVKLEFEISKYFHQYYYCLIIFTRKIWGKTKTLLLSNENQYILWYTIITIIFIITIVRAPFAEAQRNDMEPEKSYERCLVLQNEIYVFPIFGKLQFFLKC